MSKSIYELPADMAWFWGEFDPKVIRHLGTLPAKDATFAGARAHLKMADVLAELYDQTKQLTERRDLIGETRAKARRDLVNRLRGELPAIRGLLDIGRQALARQPDGGLAREQRRAEQALSAVEAELSEADRDR